MTDRSLTAAARRGLTFWRRSIQARVVASTLLLSAAVVGVVGWFLLQQTRDGLLEQRVDAVVAEANNETTEARARLAAAPGTDIDTSAQQRDLVEPIIQRGDTRGFSVVLSGPVGSGRADRGRWGDDERRPRHLERPGLAAASTSPSRPAPPGPTPRSAPRARTEVRPTPSPASSWARRSCCPPTGRPTRSTTCSRSPPSRRPWRWWRGRSSRPRCCCSCWSPA